MYGDANPGRPRDFVKRTRLMVLLESEELDDLHKHAAEVGLSASAFARAAIVAAVKAKRQLRPLRRRPDRRNVR
jgi:hypothetical protein